MEEEIKKAYMDWSEKGVSYLNCMYVYDTMMDVDEALQTCDTILDEIDLGIDYTSRKKDIDRLLEGHGTLHRYIDVLNCYVDDKLDQPLKKDFKKNATETISRIHLEDFEVDNTLGLTENNYITGGMGYAGTMVEQEKAKLTFADFIGTSDGKADGNGLHISYTNGSVEDFASIFAAQYEAMKASGALGEDNNLTQQEFLEQFYRQGEFTHDSSNPFLNFVSSVLDITIIKPIIEACTGEDLITGEDLTDMERGLKVVFAMVDLVTLGGAIAATKFSEMGLKEGLKAFGKTALIDFAGNTAACGVGALGEAFDWPVPITMMLSLAAGITVSISGNKLLFKNADGIEIGSKTLNEREWESFRDLMSPEEAARYDKYWSLKETTCTSDELYIYLKNIDTDYAETFWKTGEWPDEIQIPKNASVLNKDGSINWTKAAAGGYKLDKDGNPIKEKFIPKIGEVIDRYGPANGRYTSPIIDGKSFEYTERSLPYVENLSNYHKYKVIGDFSKIEEYVKNCPDAKLKAQVEAIVKKYYKGDYSRLASYKGEAAAVEGWGKGGAIQYELSLTVEQLERLGLLREIN
ncbi:glycohydrolase toxin TNT-related protein [Agathobacter rectalis]|uniref:glycohydrolase toxin TNT-related protein n=2 Tax=Agathobacter rectalis TaxID=39491 RepID=UPI001304C633|nr:pre-toxin TG domain-containing protein [Agathobacter rectalis]